LLCLHTRDNQKKRTLRCVEKIVLRGRRVLPLLQNARAAEKGKRKMFKKMRGVRLPYAKQGLIFFTCLTYAAQPPDIRQKIEENCTNVAGPHRQALFEVLTTQKPIYRISDERHISPNRIYVYRQRFYESW